MAAWCENRGYQQGALLSVETCWELAKAWYLGRQEMAWTRPTPEEAHVLFEGLGLTGPFWELWG